MTVIRRITATVLAAVGTVLGLLAAASVAAASPVSPNDGNGFPTSVPQPPTGTPTNSVVDSGSPWWTFVLVAAAAVAVTLLRGPGGQPDPPAQHSHPARALATLRACAQWAQARLVGKDYDGNLLNRVVGESAPVPGLLGRLPAARRVGGAYT